LKKSPTRFGEEANMLNDVCSSSTLFWFFIS
jgi:hypothetical protein